MSVGKNQLSRISISGFKSIKNCDLELKKINVLIGSNGAGKSNFISVFSLIQSVLKKQLQFTVAKSGANSFFYNGRKVTEKIKIKVYFNQNSYGFLLYPTDDNRIIFEDEFYGYDTTECTLAWGHQESQWENGVTNLTTKYIRPILEKQNWEVFHFHDTSRNAKVKQEHNLSNNQFLMNDAGNLAAFLYRLKTIYKDYYNEIVSTVRLIAPYFDDFVLQPLEYNKEQIILRWKQINCDDIFNISQFSDGTLRFICLATLLLQPKELQPETIIIDEPELGLHPYAITVFAETVQEISQYKQVIISTQSVELLNEFDTDDVIVVDRTENGTQFKRLDAESLEMWLENDYSLGDLWKKNILGGRLSK